MVKIIRENQDIVGRITNNSESSMKDISIQDISNQINLSDVSLKIETFGRKKLGNKIILNEDPSLPNILVIDCGIKNSQLRGLLQHNVHLQ